MFVRVSLRTAIPTPRLRTLDSGYQALSQFTFQGAQMSTCNPAGLLFRSPIESSVSSAPKPARTSVQKFKAMKLNPARFDTAWDKKCGAAVRLTAALLCG